MPSVHISDTTGALFMDFRFKCQRRREYAALTDTLANRQKLEKVLDMIEAEIAAGTFVTSPQPQHKARGVKGATRAQPSVQGIGASTPEPAVRGVDDSAPSRATWAQPPPVTWSAMAETWMNAHPGLPLN